jgi:hypothetical protein
MERLKSTVLGNQTSTHRKIRGFAVQTAVIQQISDMGVDFNEETFKYQTSRAKGHGSHTFAPLSRAATKRLGKETRRKQT